MNSLTTPEYAENQSQLQGNLVVEIVIIQANRCFECACYEHYTEPEYTEDANGVFLHNNYDQCV